MVRNDLTKAYYRADHLLEEHMQKLLADPKLAEDKRNEYLKIAVTMSLQRRAPPLKRCFVRAGPGGRL